MAAWRASVLLALGVLAAATAGCSGAPADSGPNKSDCASCHMAEFQSARGHVGQRPTKCAVCHGSDAWHPTGLHHEFFPLTGAHEKTKCFDCHKGEPPTFKGTAKDCVGCHRANYDKAPDHVAKHFPTTCQQCHATAAWKPPLPHEAPPPAPTESAAPAETAAPVAPTASHSPRPPPGPRPPRPRPPPQPTVEPTSNASKRL